MDERIIDFLEENEGEHTPKQIADALVVAESAVINRLSILGAAGRTNGNLNMVTLSDRERARLLELRQRKKKDEERVEVADLHGKWLYKLRWWPLIFAGGSFLVAAGALGLSVYTLRISTQSESRMNAKVEQMAAEIESIKASMEMTSDQAK